MVPRDGMLLWYDFSTAKSFRGEPTTNLVPSPYDYSTYAYVSAPSTVTVPNESRNTVSAKRYTITNAVNVARAAIYPSLSTNTLYTFSLKWRYNGTNTTSPSMAITAGKGYPEGGGGNTFASESLTTAAIGNGWYRSVYTFSLSASPTGAAILTHGITTGSDTGYLNNTFDIYEVQFETKSYATAYASGSRGTTVAAGGGVIDLSGRGNSGELLNGPTASYLSGGEVMFDGTNDHIRIPSISATSVSVAAWVRSSSWSTQTHPMIVAKGINVEWILWKSDDSGNDEKFGWRSGNGATLYSTTTAQNNVWYHLMATVGAAGMRLYVNGMLEASNGTTSVPSGSLDICVGAGISGGNPANFMAGSVRGVQVWDRQLTATEVIQNYNSSRSTLAEKITPVTSNLILNLDAGDRDSYRGTGTTWRDLSGFGYNGTLNNGPVYRSSNGGCLVFDGTNDSVTTGLTGSVVDLTVECWFLGTKSERCHLWDMGSYTGQPGDTNLNFNLNDSGYDLWIYWNGSGTNRARYAVNGSFTDGTVKQMVFTHTGSTNKTYLNGAELTLTESGGTQTFNNVNGTPGQGFRLGGIAPFGGNIYIARVYSAALSAAEVLQNYNASRRRFGL